LTPELVNFLQEALQIAEADETVWVVKFMNPKVATSLNKLRTACIELLCTTMAWADFKTLNHSELRSKIISMFFRSLTCRTPEIVAVAKEGLRQVELLSYWSIYFSLLSYLSKKKKKKFPYYLDDDICVALNYDQCKMHFLEFLPLSFSSA
jgi:hypothetical protein